MAKSQLQNKKHAPARQESYDAIRKIDGSHPMKDRVPFAYVEYQARKRKDGRVSFFNFRLAKEMGLIPDDHPERLTQKLEAVLLDTFALTIINEYDIINKTPVPIKSKKTNTYMATRYLQLQHPDKRGLQSGDGRSIWNGSHKGKGKTWDISSCGTGATCLSPAHSIQKKFFQTGDPSVSYGCGYAQVDEGISQVVFSEILNANNVPTERALAVIEFPDGYSVNVRAGLNLLRPSHFFYHLKQGNRERLKASVDFFIDRQVANKVWPAIPKGACRYQTLLQHICETFAEITARFENEYIFCWLDWDGDNILANGGIIDYGSIRQFGLFHKDYRFDDDDRFSTNILEQKKKARHTVQTFAQLVDFLRTGRKKPLQRFRKHKVLRDFDRTFQRKLYTFFLQRLGYHKSQAERLVSDRYRDAQSLFRHFRYFESVSSSRGIKQVADGIMSDAIFCVRDIMRELPGQLVNEGKAFSAKDFVTLAASQYAKPGDLKTSPYRKKRIHQLQAEYKRLAQNVAKTEGKTLDQILQNLDKRAQVINRKERVTGDTVTTLTDRLLRARKELEKEQFHRLVYELIDCQVLDPDKTRDPYAALEKASQDNERRLKSYMRLILSYREGI